MMLAIKYFARWQSQLVSICAVKTHGRLGGDEFVAMALFTSKDKINQRVATLEQKLNALSLEHQGNTIAIYASVGQINYSEAPKNLDEVLKAGDEAMYQKKSLRKAQAKQTYTRENA